MDRNGQSSCGSTIRIVCGAYFLQADCAGKTVSEVRSSFGPTVLAADDCTPYVNGVVVPEHTVLHPGDLLEFLWD